MCTQDDKLRKRLLANSPATPVVFCHTSGLQMEPPADAEGSGVASQREHGAGLTEEERNALGQEEVVRGAAGVRTNVRYKKPKARGPNPLSVKKKKWRSRRREGAGPTAATRRRKSGSAGAAARSRRENARVECVVVDRFISNVVHLVQWAFRRV